MGRDRVCLEKPRVSSRNDNAGGRCGRGHVSLVCLKGKPSIAAMFLQRARMDLHSAVRDVDGPRDAGLLRAWWYASWGEVQAARWRYCRMTMPMGGDRLSREMVMHEGLGTFQG